MTFQTREDSGKKLAKYLIELNRTFDVVLGLPRGGVVVAAEVARTLDRPLDVLVVRKIGHPRHREFAVGALAEDGSVLLDDEVVHRAGVHARELEAVIAEETERLDEYRAKFHRHGPPDLRNKRVLIVDDGLATGSTMEAATKAVRHLQARSVVVAVPVASESAVQRLKQSADEVLALVVDPGFMAVGQYYVQFPQTTDGEVMEILNHQAHAA